MRRSSGWECSARHRAPAAGLVTGFAAALGALVAPAGVALASPDGVVTTTGGDKHDSVVRVTVDYDVEVDRSRVMREEVGDPALDPLQPVPVHQDLDSSRTRHTVTPRLELGVAPGVWLSAALPVVIAESRELSLHDGVTRESSSTLRGGLLPPTGFDAQNPTSGFADGDDRVFRGRSRRGLDQVYVGIGAALMNQRRDSAKPTWKLGAEGRLSIGKVARFDAMDPSTNDAVGRGVHELRLWTTVAKRISFVETYFGIAWQAPLIVKDASLFQDLGYGSTNVKPPQLGELRLGLEAALVDRPADDLRVGVDLGARLTARFEGRDYSELWEVLALAGDARIDGAPLVLDADPVSAGVQSLSNPGVSNVENHLEMGANLAIRAQLSRSFTVALTGEVVRRTDHTITFADADIDLPTCGAGQTTGCEDATNDLSDAGTEEENPAFVAEVDLVGHRYRSTGGLGFVLGVQATGSF
jgi:hypothetical protein